MVSLYHISVRTEQFSGYITAPEKFILIPEVSFTKKEFAEQTSSEKIAVGKGNCRSPFSHLEGIYF